MKPCATCGTPTATLRCPRHTRTPNQARTLLPALITRDNNVCYICNQPCGARNRGPNSPTIDHLDGNPANNTPHNLALAHLHCNARKQTPH